MPVLLYRADGNAQHLRDLRMVEPAEEAHLDDLGHAFVQGAQAPQGLVQIEDRCGGVLAAGCEVFEQRLAPPAIALPRAIASRPIHDHAPHRLGSAREELIAIAPISAGLRGELEERVMDEHRRLQQQPMRSPVAQAPDSAGSQLVTHQQEQPLGMRDIAVRHPAQQTGYLVTTLSHDSRSDAAADGRPAEDSGR